MTVIQPVYTFPAPGQHLCGLAFDGTMLWHSDGATHELYRLEIPSGRVVQTLSCPDVRTGLAYDGQYLWQVVGKPKSLRGIDPASGATRREIPLVPATENACGVDIAGGQFWLGVENEAKLQLRSLTDGAIRREFAARPRIAGVTLAAGRVWYTEAVEGLLIQIDPDSGKELGAYSIGGMPTGLTWDGQHFWFADFNAKAIKAVRI